MKATLTEAQARADAVLVPLLRKFKKTSKDLACIARWQFSLEGIRVAFAGIDDAKGDSELKLRGLHSSAELR